MHVSLPYKITDESHRRNKQYKEPGIKEHTLYESIFIKFKNRQN